MSKKPNKTSKLWMPYCMAFGHLNVELENKPGWFSTYCGRCGRDVHKSYWWNIVRGKIPYMFLWFANKTIGDSPDYKPKFRAIDQSLKGIGTEHSCGAYSYEHIKSLLDQYKNDGLPEPLLSHLISEDGLINIEDVGAEKFVDIINKSFEAESNRREREKTMKIMNGKERDVK